MKYFVLYENVWDETELIPTNNFEETLFQLCEGRNIKYTNNENYEFHKDTFYNTESKYLLRFIEDEIGYAGRVLVLKNPLWEEEENE